MAKPFSHSQVTLEMFRLFLFISPNQAIIFPIVRHYKQGMAYGFCNMGIYALVQIATYGALVELTNNSLRAGKFCIPLSSLLIFMTLR